MITVQIRYWPTFLDVTIYAQNSSVNRVIHGKTKANRWWYVDLLSYQLYRLCSTDLVRVWTLWGFEPPTAVSWCHLFAIPDEGMVLSWRIAHSISPIMGRLNGENHESLADLPGASTAESHWDVDSCGFPLHPGDRDVRKWSKEVPRQAIFFPLNQSFCYT